MLFDQFVTWKSWNMLGYGKDSDSERRFHSLPPGKYDEEALDPFFND
jgi:hypothetical protein